MDTVRAILHSPTNFTVLIIGDSGCSVNRKIPPRTHTAFLFYCLRFFAEKGTAETDQPCPFPTLSGFLYNKALQQFQQSLVVGMNPKLDRL